MKRLSTLTKATVLISGFKERHRKASTTERANDFNNF